MTVYAIPAFHDQLHTFNDANDPRKLESQDILSCLCRGEDGDADLFTELNRNHFCFDVNAGRWCVFSGHHWQRDDLAESRQAVERVIDAYGNEANRQATARIEAVKTGRTEEAKKYQKLEDDLMKRIHALQTIARKENVLTLARTGKSSLAVRGDIWDKDPWVLGCKNGVIDLKTGFLRPGRPSDYIKTVSPVEYRGLDEPATIWERTIKEICGDYADLPDYLHRLLGYSITGLSNWHIYPIFYGPQGRNGKGTILETLKFVLGDLAHKGNSETLLESRNSPRRGSADADTLAFRGKRIIWASETNEGRKLNVSRIKELCGGDTLNARAVYGRDPVEFQPTHLLILLTNERPSAPAEDSALWERIHLVPFDVRFVDNPIGKNERPVDRDLLEKLKAEAPGILSWLVRGCLKWQESGIKRPDSVQNATTEYRQDEDIIGKFISERCETGAVWQVQASTLFAAFRDWCTDFGYAINQTRFGKEMKSRYDYTKGRNTYYIGIQLIPAEG